MRTSLFSLTGIMVNQRNHPQMFLIHTDILYICINRYTDTNCGLTDCNYVHLRIIQKILKIRVFFGC